MKHANPEMTHSLGADLRALRKARGLTLSELADAMGRSVGWMSQVERGISEPSVSDLRRLAKTMDVSVASLLQQTSIHDQEQGYIVRAEQRRPIGSRAEGLAEELVSPDLTDDFEMVHSTFAAGACITEPVTRPTQEVGFIMSGQLEMTINGTAYLLDEGDSFRVRGEPFTWRNPGHTPCLAIWVIAPPVY